VSSAVCYGMFTVTRYLEDLGVVNDYRRDFWLEEERDTYTESRAGILTSFHQQQKGPCCRPLSSVGCFSVMTG